MVVLPGRQRGTLVNRRHSSKTVMGVATVRTLVHPFLTGVIPAQAGTQWDVAEFTGAERSH